MTAFYTNQDPPTPEGPIFDNQPNPDSIIPSRPINGGIPIVKPWYQSTVIVSNSIAIGLVVIEALLSQTVLPISPEWQVLITALVIAIVNILNRVRITEPTIIKPVTL